MYVVSKPRRGCDHSTNDSISDANNGDDDNSDDDIVDDLCEEDQVVCIQHGVENHLR